MNMCSNVRKPVAFVLLIFLALELSGCSSKESDKDSEAENSQTQTKVPEKSKDTSDRSAPGGNLETAIKLWEKGNKSEAIEEFITIDWQKTEHFSQSSVFRLSEQEFAALSENERNAKMPLVMQGLSTMKHLCKAVIEKGKTSDTPEKYYTAVHEFGVMLSSQDKLMIVQITGKAVKALAATR